MLRVPEKELAVTFKRGKKFPESIVCCRTLTLLAANFVS